MRTRLFLSSFLILLLFSSCKEEKVEDDLFLLHIQEQIDSLLLDNEFESLSLGLIKGDQNYEFYGGRLINGDKPNRESLYEIASLTKTFTGTLAAQAVVDKKIDLDEDIRTYLPGEFPNLEYGGQGIKVRDILTHTGGIPRMFPDVPDLFVDPDFDKLPDQINALQKDFSKEAFFEELGKVKLDTLPGINFSYSNAGANLMGYILEEVYQKDFELLLKEFIFDPLDMEHSSIGISDEKRDRLVEGQNFNQLKMPFSVAKDMSAEGGIISGIDDLLKYARYHLAESKEVVSTSHQDLWDGAYGDFGTGFFWQLNRRGEAADLFFQNGGAFGTSSWTSLIPEEEIAVIMISNVSGPDIHRKMSERVEKIIALMTAQEMGES